MEIAEFIDHIIQSSLEFLRFSYVVLTCSGLSPSLTGTPSRTPRKVNHVQHPITQDVAAEVLAIKEELVVTISIGVVRDMGRHNDTGHVPELEVVLR